MEKGAANLRIKFESAEISFNDYQRRDEIKRTSGRKSYETVLFMNPIPPPTVWSLVRLLIMHMSRVRVPVGEQIENLLGLYNCVHGRILQRINSIIS